MPRIGLGLVGDHTCEEMIRYAKVAERNGYESVWVAEDLGFRDAIVPLSSLAISTSTIKLATGILPVYYRPPALTAMTVATLDELSKGRAILGIGSGARHLVEKQGIEMVRPLRMLDEYVSIVRLLLSGESVSRQGYYRLREVEFCFRPFRTHIPVYIAARGPMMFQLAGRIGDGVLMSDGFCTPSYIRYAQENVRRGIEKTGQERRDFDSASFVILSMAEEREAAKRHAKSAVVSLLGRGTFDPYFRIMGLSPDEMSPSKLAWRKGNTKEACEKIPDSMIDASVIYGTAEECARGLRKLRAEGIDLPVILPQGARIGETIELAKDW